MGGMIISVYPDYTTQVAGARAGYNAVRQQLRGLQGVKYGILYPARFRITHNNQERIFSTPGEAQVYISKNISTQGLLPVIDCYDKEYILESETFIRTLQVLFSVC